VEGLNWKNDWEGGIREEVDGLEERGYWEGIEDE